MTSWGSQREEREHLVQRRRWTETETGVSSWIVGDEACPGSLDSSVVCLNCTSACILHVCTASLPVFRTGSLGHRGRWSVALGGRSVRGPRGCCTWGPPTEHLPSEENKATRPKGEGGAGVSSKTGILHTT